MKKRIVYAGTPDFAVPALRALIEGQGGDYEIVAVYTQPDRPAGRGRKLQPSPVKSCANEFGIPVYQPLSLKDPAAKAELVSLQPDLMVVAAYGLLLPADVLIIPALGCVNLHASLLPRWRGAAPIQRAIEAGDAETGITLMQMDVGLDTGAMLAKVHTPIGEADSGQSLHDRLAKLGAELLMRHLPALLAGELEGEAQDDSLAIYAAKLSKAEARIDWAKPARELARQVKAMNPWPVMQAARGDSVLRIWWAEALESEPGGEPGRVIACGREGLDVATGAGVLRVTRLQLPGGKPLDIQAFANAHDLSGEVLG